MFKKKRKILSYSLIMIVLVSAMVFICEEVFARAGGGGRYSGGSRSSGGGGGGGGELIYYIFKIIWHVLMWLCRECPIIGYPLTALFIAFVVYLVIMGMLADREKQSDVNDEDSSYGASAFTGSSKNSNYEELYGTDNPDLDSSALYDIKKYDPDFNIRVFCSRAKKAFNLIQYAWSKRDLSKVEAFLADGTYEQFMIQIEIMKENHIIDVMEQLQINDVSVLGYESDNGIDTIFLSITASASNYYADDKTNKLVEGDKKVKAFTEIWTFIRRTGAKTLGNPGLIEGFCPNCGAKISIGRHTNCSSCGCLLRSGEHDWILSNITQECEWTRHNNKLIPGVKKYIAFDPGFNVQHIEDLVSMMFWRKQMSDRKMNIASFRKIATEKYCDSIKKFYHSPEYIFYDDCAVGSIKILAIDAEKSETEDYIYVEVAWDGIPKTQKDKEKNLFNSIKKMFQKRKLVRSVFLLKRKRGVLTDTKKGLCAAPCPNCGAMETHSSNNECEYCGAVMNDGNRDWVVDNILKVDDPSIDIAISRVKKAGMKPIKFKGYSKPNYSSKGNVIQGDTPPQATDSPNVNTIISNMAAAAAASASVGVAANVSKASTVDNNTNNINNDKNSEILALPYNASPEDHIKWLIGMMMVDGDINKAEFAIICEYAFKLGLTEEDVSKLVKSLMGLSKPIENLVNTVPLPQSAEFMQVLIRVIFADGRIAKEELNMLRYVAKRINFSETKLRELFEMEKSRFKQRQQQQQATV